MLEPKNIGDRLKFVRELLGFTQSEIAVRYGKKQQYWAVYETGTKIPHTLLQQLAEDLPVTLDYLVLGKITKFIGSKLELARKSPKNRLKAEDVAQKLGVTREFIFAIEEGKIEPSGSFLSKLCALYGINEFEVRDENIRHVPAHSTTGDSWLDSAITKHRELIELIEQNPEIEPKIIKILEGLNANKELHKRLNQEESNG